jgi:hypothetical protein
MTLFMLREHATIGTSIDDVANLVHVLHLRGYPCSARNQVLFLQEAIRGLD